MLKDFQENQSFVRSFVIFYARMETRRFVQMTLQLYTTIYRNRVQSTRSTEGRRERRRVFLNRHSILTESCKLFD